MVNNVRPIAYVRPSLAIICSIVSLVFWIIAGNWVVHQVRLSVHNTCTSNNYSWLPMSQAQMFIVNGCRRMIDNFFTDEPGCVAARYFETQLLSMLRYSNMVFVTSVFAILVSQAKKVIQMYHQRKKEQNTIDMDPKMLENVHDYDPFCGFFQSNKGKVTVEELN